MILINLVTNAGANTAAHLARRVEIDPARDIAVVHVHMFANEDAARLDGSPLWSEPVAIPLPMLAAPIMGSIEAWLTTSPDSKFVGGTVVSGAPGDLASIKERRWVAMKGMRDAAEFGGFTWNNVVFDSTPQAQSRIQGASQLATLAMLASQAFSVDWTLADNSVVTLSGAQVIDVGRAMGEHIVTVHAIGRDVRSSIEAATTAEEVAAITWPAG